MSHTYLKWGVVAVALFLGGCMGSSQQRSQQRTYMPQQQPYMAQQPQYMSNMYMKQGQGRQDAFDLASNKFDDIPLPTGFNLIVGESFVFKNGLTRVGITRYDGRGDIPSLTNFFKSQMPMYNWELLNSIEHRRTIINFEKESQSCTIILEQQGSSKVIITIASGPIGQ